MAFTYGDKIYVKIDGKLYKGTVISCKIVNKGVFWPDIKKEYVVKLDNNEAILADEDDVYVSD